MSVTGWWHSDKNRQKKVRNLGCFAIVLFVGFSCYAFGFGIPDVLTLRSVPVPSDAEVVIDGRDFIFTEFGFENKVMYYTDQPWPEVVAFYREEMSRRGWQLAEEKTKQFPDGVWICMGFTWHKVITVGIRIDGYQVNDGGEQDVDRRTIVDAISLFLDTPKKALEWLSC
jgi:hypothetical protein